MRQIKQNMTLKEGSKTKTWQYMTKTPHTRNRQYGVSHCLLVIFFNGALFDVEINGAATDRAICCKSLELKQGQ